jgi:hypothetical protein
MKRASRRRKPSFLFEFSALSLIFNKIPETNEMSDESSIKLKLNQIIILKNRFFFDKMIKKDLFDNDIDFCNVFFAIKTIFSGCSCFFLNRKMDFWP